MPTKILGSWLSNWRWLWRGWEAQDRWQEYEDGDGSALGFCHETFDRLSAARDVAREAFRESLKEGEKDPQPGEQGFYP